MRWFVVFLLIANIALFFWVQQSSLNPASHAEIPPPEVGRLRLLNESPTREPPPPANPATVAEEASATAPEPLRESAPAASEAGVQMPAEPSVAPAAPSPLASIAEVARQAEREAEAQPVVAGEPVAEEPPQAAALPDVAAAVIEPPAPPVNTPAVESQPAVAAAEPAAAPPPEDPPAASAAEAATAEPPSPALVCSRLGPFAPDDADAMLARLPAEVTLISDTTDEAPKVDGYYVLIPALPDRASGLRKLEELKEAGLTDTWLFRRGEYRNAISLGLFRRQASAQRHADTVASKGFDVELREKTSSVERRWLLVRHVEGSDLREMLTLPDGIRAASRACPADPVVDGR